MYRMIGRFLGAYGDIKMYVKNIIVESQFTGVLELNPKYSCVAVLTGANVSHYKKIFH